MSTSLIAITLSTPVIAQPVFNRIASFPTVANFAEGEDKEQETSAEIMAATEDGNTLIYSDSPLKALGMIDISDPKAPKPLGHIAMNGEPTTTVVLGNMAFVGVNTSESRAAPSGALRSVDLKTKQITASCDIGGQPDAVALREDGSEIAIAIENERDEDVNDGAIPQMPAGYVVTLPLADGAVDCAGLKKIDLTGLAEIASDDPEPEYVTYNDAGELAVTLQENNHIVIIDATGKVASHFSAGSVDLAGIDTEDDGRIEQTENLSDVIREPDAVAWLGNDHFVTANEGDWNGGSRSFTIWNKDGNVTYDSGALLDRKLAKLGHYPDGRSDNKGGEPEAVITANYDGVPMIFVASERGSMVFGFDATDPSAPVLVQAFPSGIGPEGLVAIPQRGLFAIANETDLGEDGAARAHVMVYEHVEDNAAYPTITSEGSDPLVPWGALSGLAADPGKPKQLYAVSDSVLNGAPSVYTIDATQNPARIIDQTIVTRDGQPAERLDLEGIALDGAGGFWLASEGDSEKEIPHAVLHVNADGEIQQEVALPDALDAHETRFGFEGIQLIDGKLWLAVQREWGDDPEGMVKLLQLDPVAETWAAVHYPLEKSDGWVGLSDLAQYNGELYVIERDNLIGDAAKLKQITRVAIDDLNPAKLGDKLPVVTKEVLRDLIPDLKSGGGYVVDKVEGLAINADGTAYVVTDNDGTDDSSGETYFWSFSLKQ